MSTNIPRIAREAIELSEKAGSKHIEVYRCDGCNTGHSRNDDSACGFDGQSYDYSRDECGHPFFLTDARLYAHAKEHYGALARYVEDTAAIVEAARRLENTRESWDPWLDELFDAVRAYRAKGAK